MGTVKVPKKVIAGFLCNLAVVILGIVGIVLSFRGIGWQIFRYYTVCSNLLAVIMCFVMAAFQFCWILDRRYGVPNIVKIGKYISTCMLLITFLVVLALLAPQEEHYGTLLLEGEYLELHFLCPVLSVISFLFLDETRLIDRYLTVVALIPTLIYGIIIIILNLTDTLTGPYFFLEIKQNGAGTTVLYVLLVLFGAWIVAQVLHLLTLRGKLPEMPGIDAPEKAYSEDGYVKDQDYLKGLRYRTVPASYNSCGCVATYNLRHAEGDPVAFSDVLQEMNDMHHLNMPGPTANHVMRRYLKKYLPGGKEITGKEEARIAAGKSRMGIFRYREEGVPHFVSYLKQGDAFRFFNVNNGLEDCCMTMEEFVEKHCVQGKIRLFYWN